MAKCGYPTKSGEPCSKSRAEREDGLLGCSIPAHGQPVETRPVQKISLKDEILGFVSAAKAEVKKERGRRVHARNVQTSAEIAAEFTSWPEVDAFARQLIEAGRVVAETELDEESRKGPKFKFPRGKDGVYYVAATDDREAKTAIHVIRTAREKLFRAMEAKKS